MAKKKKKKKSRSAPPAPEPINFGQVMQQAGAAASQSARDQLAATAEFYPRMEDLQFGTVSRLAGNLNNAYTQESLNAVRQSMAGVGSINNEGQRLSSLGQNFSDFALQNYLASGPTDAERNIQALGQSAMGVRADQIVAPSQDAVRNVSAQQVAASRMGDFGRAVSRDITAGQVESGTLGGTLMSRAQTMAQSTGRLSGEAERDAVQSARQGMAARGLATGGAGMAAEMLNRDRYSRQRQFEDLGFSQGVQAQDLTRQFQNVGNQLNAAQSNQQAAMQAELANLEARYNAAAQNGNWQQAAAIQNQSANLQASLANQSRDQFLAAAGMDAQQANQQVNMNQREMNRAFMLNANQAFNQGTLTRRDQAAQQAALGGNLMQGAAAQFGNAANLGLAGGQAIAGLDPYGRAIGQGFQTGGNTQANLMSGIGTTYGNALQAGVGIAGFNTNMQASNYNSFMNNQAALQAARIGAGAMNRSATMGMLGSAIQGGIQAGGMIGAAQFAPAMFSDKRMKKDIKPLGKAGSVLGLTAYEYSYKDDDQKRVGFMAQDVQKVLPEAVTEVDYKGKKRLAIKPAVIGAALAEELMAAKAA
jgi:hypothetical protein